MPSLFPVTLTVTCPTCNFQQRSLTAEDLSALNWIEVAGNNGHALYSPDCTAKPVLRVVE